MIKGKLFSMQIHAHDLLPATQFDSPGLIGLEGRFKKGVFPYFSCNKIGKETRFVGTVWVLADDGHPGTGQAFLKRQCSLISCGTVSDDDEMLIKHGSSAYAFSSRIRS